MDGFIRIQKTASTSLDQALLKHNTKVFLHGFCYQPSNIQGWKWKGVNNQVFNLNEYSNLYATVRNPFDLLISYYTHSKDGDGWGDCNKIHSITSWDDFLSKYTDPYFDWHIPQMKKSLFSFMYDQNWNIIATKIFKYEKLDELESHFNIKLKHINYTSKKKVEYQELYSPYYINKLSNIWSKDLKLFNYTF